MGGGGGGRAPGGCLSHSPVGRTHERPRTERLCGSCARQATRRQEKGAALVPLVREEGRRRGGGERRGGSARGCRDNVWSWRGTKSAHACAATARWLSRCGLCERTRSSLSVSRRDDSRRDLVSCRRLCTSVWRRQVTESVGCFTHMSRHAGSGGAYNQQCLYALCHNAQTHKEAYKRYHTLFEYGFIT